MTMRVFGFLWCLAILGVACDAQFFSEQPGDQKLVGLVGESVVVPCVTSQVYGVMGWAEVTASGEESQVTVFGERRIKPEFTQHYQLIRSSGTDFSIRVLSLRLPQPKLYCRVANPGTKFSSFSNITVLAPPAGAPVCETSPRDVSEGDDVRLTCKSSGGIPAAELAWRLEGRVIEAGPGEQGPLVPPEGRSSRTLHHQMYDVRKEDHNKLITCLAENEATRRMGSHFNCTTTINVLYAPAVEISGGLTVRQGEPVQFTCRQTEANPDIDSYFWFRDGREIDTSNLLKKNKGTEEDIQVYSQAMCNHTGPYSCRGSNSEGMSPHNSLQLTVLCSPEKPTNLRLAAVSANSLTVSWTPGWDGGVAQTFYVSYRQWTQASNGDQSQDVEKVITILDDHASVKLVEDIVPDTDFEVKVWAENSVGISDREVGKYSTKSMPGMKILENEINTNADGAVQFTAYFTSEKSVSHLVIRSCVRGLNMCSDETVADNFVNESVTVKLKPSVSYTITVGAYDGDMLLEDYTLETDAISAVTGTETDTMTYGIIGGAVGVLVIIVLIVILILVCSRRRNKRQDRGFQCDGPAVEKALDPVVDFIQGTTELFEFVERKYFEYFGRVSKLKLCRPPSGEDSWHRSFKKDDGYLVPSQSNTRIHASLPPVPASEQIEESLLEREISLKRELSQVSLERMALKRENSNPGSYQNYPMRKRDQKPPKPTNFYGGQPRCSDIIEASEHTYMDIDEMRERSRQNAGYDAEYLNMSTDGDRQQKSAIQCTDCEDYLNPQSATDAPKSSIPLKLDYEDMRGFHQLGQQK